MLASRVALLFLLMSGLCGIAGATPNPLHGVRFGQHQTFSRVVFDLQEQGPYRLVASDTPQTIVIEFPEIQQLPAQTAWVAQNPLVQTVRFSAEPAGVRAEIHLRQPGQVHRHFRMKAPARVVVDISPDRPAISANPGQQAPTMNEEPRRDPAVAKVNGNRAVTHPWPK